MDRPQDGPMNPPPTIEECKRALVEDDQPAPGSPPSPRDVLFRHPVLMLALAAGAGAALVFFPRVRKLALPLAVAVVKRSIL